LGPVLKQYKFKLQNEHQQFEEKYYYDMKFLIFLVILVIVGLNLSELKKGEEVGSLLKEELNILHVMIIG